MTLIGPSSPVNCGASSGRIRRSSAEGDNFHVSILSACQTNGPPSVPRAAVLSNSLLLIGKSAIGPYYRILVKRTRWKAKNNRAFPGRSKNNGLKVGLAKAEQFKSDATARREDKTHPLH